MAEAFVTLGIVALLNIVALVVVHRDKTFESNSVSAADGISVAFWVMALVIGIMVHLLPRKPVSPQGTGSADLPRGNKS